jgi:cyclopropane-fatty-acyl-phospholipid synthase
MGRKPGTRLAFMLKPFFDQIRAHYDLSNEFYALFLDPTLTYSCAIFERPEATLEEAQYAKLDHALAKADIRPGMRVLDIGFGWGSCVRRAAEKYGAEVTGLTLSLAQHEFVSQSLREKPPSRGSAEIRIQGWEEFHEPVDRIVTIEVFEHFRRERYTPFFQRCRELLPADGKMYLQTSVMYDWRTLESRGVKITHEQILFAKFMGKYIFPGGDLCEPKTVVQFAEKNGFSIEESGSLARHYVRTLDIWAANLQSRREEAIALTSPEVYDRYMHYLTGCAKYFRAGHIDVWWFLMAPRSL